MAETKLLERDALIEGYAKYIVDEYIKAGGAVADATIDGVYWSLWGIYDREGAEALEEFVKN